MPPVVRLVVLAVAGIAIVLLTIVDAIWTTLWLEGHAGPVARHVSGGVRAGTRKLAGVGKEAPATPEEHRRLSLTGPLVLVLVLLLWVTLLLVGWVVLFSASPTSILRNGTHAPVSLGDRVAYVGYAMLTLGSGDFVPNGDAWQIATVLAGLSGLVLVTLSLSFLVAVVGAVVATRSFSTQVFGLGRCGEAFVINAWDGRGFPAIELQLMSLAAQLGTVTEQHEAYPMLHYYHAQLEHRAASSALAVFDTALLLLERGVRHECRPAPTAIRVARQAVRGYLETLRDVYITPSGSLPPPPNLDRLRDAGIPVVADETFAGDIRGDDERRRLLLALIENERRVWPPADRP